MEEALDIEVPFRLVFLVRDPRAVINSLLNAPDEQVRGVRVEEVRISDSH